MDRLQLIIDLIMHSRAYAVRVLSHTESSRWFEMPTGCPSHVAWQVGHLAHAKAAHIYRGILERDPPAGLIDYGRYSQLFGARTQATPDSRQYPTAASLRTTFDRVHAAAMADLAGLDASRLDVPVEHPIARTTYELARWNAQHEMLHIGQIGAIRRLLGMPPWR